MFTGLVETVGSLSSVRRRGDEFDVAIASDLPTAELALGESVAVNGCCLTVTRTDAGASAFHASVSPETLSRTNLGDLGVGDSVNLERAMRLGDRLGGHLVLGHVDARGVLRSVEPRGNSTHVRVGAPTQLMPFIVEKGSIAVDGISLTVNALDEEGFDLMIVPYTADAVALLDRPRGWRVNLEVDVLGKYVARLLAAGRLPDDASWASLLGTSEREGDAGITMATLREHGFADQSREE